MIRDGVVESLTPGTGHAADEGRSPALRAASLALAVPRRAALTGLAALWVHGWEGGSAAPPLLEVAVRRGCHPGAPKGTDSLDWAFVTDQATCRSATVVGGVLVADATHAAAAALARGSLAPAIGALLWAVTQALIDPKMFEATLLESTFGGNQLRARSAWDAACEAIGAR